jgi:predicted neutral ceramidase superfamily lipid hydrolase
MKVNKKTDSDLDKIIVYWKKRIQFVFVILISLLIIYLFNPIYDHKALINSQIKILLFIFGFILFITAKWNTFFEESIWFKELQNIIGDEN